MSAVPDRNVIRCREVASWLIWMLFSERSWSDAVPRTNS